MGQFVCICAWTLWKASNVSLCNVFFFFKCCALQPITDISVVHVNAMANQRCLSESESTQNARYPWC